MKGPYKIGTLARLTGFSPACTACSAATLADVVQVYNSKRALGLTAGQMSDLTEYLKSL